MQSNPQARLLKSFYFRMAFRLVRLDLDLDFGGGGPRWSRCLTPPPRDLSRFCPKEKWPKRPKAAEKVPKADQKAVENSQELPKTAKSRQQEPEAASSSQRRSKMPPKKLQVSKHAQESHKLQKWPLVVVAKIPKMTTNCRKTGQQLPEWPKGDQE